MKETTLSLLPLIVVSVPIPTLVISLAFGLSQGHVVLACLRWLLPLLATSLLFYIENLLVLRLLCLRLALVSVALLGVFVVALELLALVLFFQSSTEVIVRSTILLKFVVEVFDGLRLFPS